MREEITRPLVGNIEVITSISLSFADLDSILKLCDRANDKDLRPLFAVYPNPLHLIIRSDSTTIAHACLIERWFKVSQQSPMRTGFVKAVATDPYHQGHGHGTALMKRIAEEADRLGFEIGGRAMAWSLRV